ncbi:hypothetical protein HU200_001408 [Digitaria exilis]|uniref:Bifunctional inhibitor/plant lipid transfer protein/seed storage helical domain-containing protein n=1 Tax=Digitaria exilis TaxID=1010633 RepID=A0A835FYP5_9POAL|nr:hypothetical protein HU200_001408 [Digitaria exilis]
MAAVFLAGGASAQSSSLSSSSCTSVLVSLSPCLNYISGNVSTPPASCCTQLGNVVKSNPACLCVALNADPASLGITVNRTLALGLPAACNVATPDVSNCSKGGAGAPASSPESGTTTTPAGATGSKATPATGSVAGAAAALNLGYGGLKVAGFVAAAVLAVVAA